MISSILIHMDWFYPLTEGISDSDSSLRLLFTALNRKKRNYLHFNYASMMPRFFLVSTCYSTYKDEVGRCLLITRDTSLSIFLVGTSTLIFHNCRKILKCTVNKNTITSGPHFPTLHTVKNIVNTLIKFACQSARLS